MPAARTGALPLLALALAALPRHAAAQAPLPLLSYDATRGYYDPISGQVYGQAIPSETPFGDAGGTISTLRFADAAGNALSTASNETTITLSYPVETTYVTTDLQQTDHTYSTTIDALLSGGGVFDRTFALPYADPMVQAAMVEADALLAADGAASGAPALASSALTDLGSQTTTQETGRTSLTLPIVTTPYVGPAIVPIYAGGPQPSVYRYVFFGGIDFNGVTDTQVTVDQTVTTTTTDLLTQRYVITGTPRGANAVPEPGSLALLALGLLPVGLLARKRRRSA